MKGSGFPGANDPQEWNRGLVSPVGEKLGSVRSGVHPETRGKGFGRNIGGREAQSQPLASEISKGRALLLRL
jgi:hypothetical protein